MDKSIPEYSLEFLLAFDGLIHYLEENYWIKFEIKRVKSRAFSPYVESWLCGRIRGAFLGPDMEAGSTPLTAWESSQAHRGSLKMR